MESMNKQEYLNSLEDIIHGSIYLTSRTDELEYEIQTNHWSIGIDSVTAKSVEQADLITFLNRVRENRVEQLRLSTVDADLLFYLWFDEQAGNLNFNFINSNHSTLPFNSEIEFVANESSIVNEFLLSNHVDGIEWSELQDLDDSVEGVNEVLRVKVYKEVLKRKTTIAQQKL
jgi:hypothetical protein